MRGRDTARGVRERERERETVRDVGNLYSERQGQR